MVKKGTKKVMTAKFRAYVTLQDIEGADCRDANHCMGRVALERKLRQIEPDASNHHTRVDAGHIRFNYEGYRWVADTPKLLKASLIAYDLEHRVQRKARSEGKPYVSKVKPFDFTVIAERRSKIVPNTDHRRQKINEARNRRKAAGEKPKRYTLHQRVVGFA